MTVKEICTMIVAANKNGAVELVGETLVRELIGTLMLTHRFPNIINITDWLGPIRVKIDEWKHSREKMAAIKYLRTEYELRYNLKLGLKEAKDYVEWVWGDTFNKPSIYGL